MILTPHQHRFLLRVLSHWQNQELLDDEQACQLKKSLMLQHFDWLRLSRYAFRIAALCFIVTLIVIFSDWHIIEKLYQLFHHDTIIRIGLPFILSGSFLLWGIRRHKTASTTVFATEALLFIAVTCLSWAGLEAAQLLLPGYRSKLMLFIACNIFYVALALIMRSSFIWLFALIETGIFLDEYTGTLSGNLFYDLLYDPLLRLIILGSLLLMACAFFPQKLQRYNIRVMSKIIGLVYLNLPVFTEIFTSSRALIWAGSSLVSSSICIILGIKNGDPILKSFGSGFFLLTLFGLFSLYGWNITSKTLFFSLLTLSLSALGYYAHKRASHDHQSL